MSKCKARTKKRTPCSWTSVLDGYCVKHYVMYHEKKTRPKKGKKRSCVLY